MRKLVVLLSLLFYFASADGQVLKLKARKADAMSGSEFAKSIADTALSLQKREEFIYKEIKNGNVPNFLRKLRPITQTSQTASGLTASITYFVLPDYMCIGSDDDFLYMPMTPILAQRVANLTKCSLPTKKIVDTIYKNASIKLEPQPIPPTKAMTTVPVFFTHSEIVRRQLISYLNEHKNSSLTAGNKKDIVISNKIYGEKSDRVVIYGWHKLDGKAIQPLYNKHVNTWADYSHGVRLVQNKINVNGKRTTLAKILADPSLNVLLSDEGVIENGYYPITGY